jgi:hypothetical protein
VAFAVDFEERLVVGPDDVDAESVAFGALGVEGSAAAIVVAGDSDAHHVAAHCADVGVLLAAVDQVHPLHPLTRQVVSALRPEHIAGYVDELPQPLSLHPVLHDAQLEVTLSPHQS